MTNASVLMRFAVRIGVLLVFALSSQRGLAPVLGNLMIAAASICMIFAQLRREKILSPTLTNWDYASFYVIVYLILQHLPLLTQAAKISAVSDR